MLVLLTWNVSAYSWPECLCSNMVDSVFLEAWGILGVFKGSSYFSGHSTPFFQASTIKNMVTFSLGYKKLGLSCFEHAPQCFVSYTAASFFYTHIMKNTVQVCLSSFLGAHCFVP